MGMTLGSSSILLTFFLDTIGRDLGRDPLTNLPIPSPLRNPDTSFTRESLDELIPDSQGTRCLQRLVSCCR